MFWSNPMSADYVLHSRNVSHLGISLFKFRCFPSNKCPQRRQGGSSALHVVSRFVSFPANLGIFQDMRHTHCSMFLSVNKGYLHIICKLQQMTRFHPARISCQWHCCGTLQTVGNISEGQVHGRRAIAW